ncbi:MAG: HDOD domain-containing protein [Pedobacter sp.]
MAISLDLKQLLSIQPIDLPVFHPVALDLMRIVSDPYSDIEDIIRVINKDQALSTHVLKMANSSAYMGLIKTETIKDSVVRLGVRQVTSLAVASSQASLYKSDNIIVNEIMRELWQHSLVCALGCWWVARHTGHQSIIDHAYLAGLLHDIGKLYLLKAMERIIQNNEMQIVIERDLMLDIFAEMHVEQGCRIMEYWNISPIYRSVVANHHAEHYDHVDSPLSIVRLVNRISKKASPSLVNEPEETADDILECHLLDMDESQFKKLKAAMKRFHEISM